MSNLIARLEKEIADIQRPNSYGHSIEFGGHTRNSRRYSPYTGERIWSEPEPAILRCHSRKMRAIWDLWEAAPQIFALIRELQGTPKEQKPDERQGEATAGPISEQKEG